jgi:hypothetical protein
MDIATWIGNALMIAGIVLIVGLLGFYFWLKHFNDRLEDALVDLVQQLEAQMIGLDVEVDNGLYYCYNAKDKQFICQGINAQEIIDRFQARYPDKIAYLAKESDDPAIKDLIEQLIKLKDETSHSQ